MKKLFSRKLLAWVVGMVTTGTATATGQIPPETGTHVMQWLTIAYTIIQGLVDIAEKLGAKKQATP